MFGPSIVNKLIMASTPFDSSCEEFPEGSSGYIHCIEKGAIYDSATAHSGITNVHYLKEGLERCHQQGHLIRRAYVAPVSEIDEYRVNGGTYLGPEKLRDLFDDRNQQIIVRLIKTSVQPDDGVIPEGFAPWWMVLDKPNKCRDIVSVDPGENRSYLELAKLYASPEEIASFSVAIGKCRVLDLQVRLQIPKEVYDYPASALKAVGLKPSDLLWGVSLD